MIKKYLIYLILIMSGCMLNKNNVYVVKEYHVVFLNSSELFSVDKEKIRYDHKLIFYSNRMYLTWFPNTKAQGKEIFSNVNDYEKMFSEHHVKFPSKEFFNELEKFFNNGFYATIDPKVGEKYLENGWEESRGTELYDAILDKNAPWFTGMIPRKNKK